MGLNRIVAKLAEAIVKEAKTTLRDSDVVDVSISSESYGVEATPELAKEILRRGHRRGLTVYRDLKYSYFTFRRRQHED